MDYANEDYQFEINISEQEIATSAMAAILGTKGVHSLQTGLARNLLNMDPHYKGLKINITDEGLVIDIYVIVDYGVKIPEVTWDIQENVKAKIESLSDLMVNAINIHVQGVHFNEETEG